jgi:hypothetical protein
MYSEGDSGLATSHICSHLRLKRLLFLAAFETSLTYVMARISRKRL